MKFLGFSVARVQGIGDVRIRSYFQSRRWWALACMLSSFCLLARWVTAAFVFALAERHLGPSVHLQWGLLWI